MLSKIGTKFSIVVLTSEWTICIWVDVKCLEIRLLHFFPSASDMRKIINKCHKPSETAKLATLCINPYEEWQKWRTLIKINLKWHTMVFCKLSYSQRNLKTSSLENKEWIFATKEMKCANLWRSCKICSSVSNWGKSCNLQQVCRLCLNHNII